MTWKKKKKKRNKNNYNKCTLNEPKVQTTNRFVVIEIESSVFLASMKNFH